MLFVPYLHARLPTRDRLFRMSITQIPVAYCLRLKLKIAQDRFVQMSGMLAEL